MKKILFSSLLLTTFLTADNFEQFLEKAVENSPYLKASKLDIEVVKQQSDKLLRYENPSLGVDYERFSPNIREDDNGYSITISQPIRLWGMGDDKEALAEVMKEGATLGFSQKKALFIYELSKAFLEYREKKSLLALAKEKKRISKKIYAISKSKFEAGNIAKKELLQAKSSMLKEEIENQTLELEVMQNYYELLSKSGISEDIKLNTNHNFKLQKQAKQNPSLKLLQNRKNLALAKAEVEANKVESINLSANYEKEYEQDISTIGFSLPLALFNTKSQEKKIATIKAKQAEYLIEKEQRKFSLLIKKLTLQRDKLFKLKKRQKRLLQTEQKLLTMFQEGYKISKSNLLQLQHAKNSLINTKKQLIFLNRKIDENIIQTNYLQGAYHE